MQMFIFMVNNVTILISHIFHFRTKSQKRRFEEELNERMIQAIDGINAQKYVSILCCLLDSALNRSVVAGSMYCFSLPCSQSILE